MAKRKRGPRRTGLVEWREGDSGYGLRVSIKTLVWDSESQELELLRTLGPAEKLESTGSLAKWVVQVDMGGTDWDQALHGGIMLLKQQTGLSALGVEIVGGFE